VGGALGTFQLSPPPAAATLRQWLANVAFPTLVGRPAVISAALGEADLAATLVPAKERQLRAVADKTANWVVLVEGLEASEVDAACREVLSPDALQRNGAEPEADLAVYRLLYCLTR